MNDKVSPVKQRQFHGQQFTLISVDIVESKPKANQEQPRSVIS